jgi:hypothetical protein
MSTKAFAGIGAVIIFLVLLPLFPALLGKAEEPEIPYTGKPEVVALIPDHGAADISPDLKSISMHFNVAMKGGFSLTGQTPEIVSKPQWSDDKKTLTIPVSLLEGHRYRFGLNSQSFQNFIDENGVALTPRIWEFATLNRNGSAARVSEPPSVVSLDPPNGATAVNPSKSQLTITFDVPMGEGRSITGQPPDITSTPQWSADKKTLTIPVRLVSGRTYRFGLNSPSYRNFRSVGNLELVPITWQFSTAR